MASVMGCCYNVTYQNKRKVERSETLLLDDKLPEIGIRYEVSALAKQGGYIDEGDISYINRRNNCS